MKKILLLAATLALPLSVWAGAKDQAECAAGGNADACYDNGGASRQTDPVYAADSSGQGSSRLSKSSSRRSYTADVPDASGTSVETYKRPGFLKRHKKMIMGMLLAGGGGYLGYTHVARWGLLGGPWGGAAAGAAAGIILGMFVLPKLFGLFHHHKKS